MQDCQSRCTGLLGLSPDTASPGLQALVRLYHSNPQRLGYVFPALPDSFQLLDGRVVLPRGRLVSFRPSSGISSRAADVFRGSIEEMPVVLKTSAHINEEVSNLSSMVLRPARAKLCISTELRISLFMNHA